MTRLPLILPVLCAFLLLITACEKDTPNKVPVADAGSAQGITLTVDSLSLTGSGTDADGQVVAYLWSQVSGPSSTIIENPGSPSTVVHFFEEGTYIFQLMVTDNDGATGVDTTSVVVNPSPVQTLTLQPANNPLELELAVYNGQDQSYSGAPDIPVAAWTINSLPLTIREIIKFDLSSIPANATILSANLYLYSYPPPTLNGNFTDANYGTDNTLFIQQVTSNWATATVDWFNQPSSTTTNQVEAASTTQSMLDLNVDVKNMVSSMISGNSNYGFLLKLKTETIYTSRIFVSSYNTTYPDKHPKLVVTYQQ